MTAKELIKLLQEHPEDMEIILEYDGWHYRANGITKEIVEVTSSPSRAEKTIEGLVIT